MRIGLVLGLAALCLLCPFGAATGSAEDVTTEGTPPNAGTLTIMSGTTFDGTAVIARDLAALVGNGRELRVVPMIGQDPAQTLKDILFLGSVDMGVTQSVVLNHYARTGELGPIRDRLVYVAKLFNEDVHLLARAEVPAIEALDGKTVNVGPAGSSTQIAADIVFGTLGLEIQQAHLEAADAIAQLRSGAIDATILIGPTPIAGLSKMGADGDVKLLPIPYPQGLEDDAYPTVLTHDDYPALIARGAQIDTLGICAVLVSLDGGANPARHAKLEHFISRFFTDFDALRRSPNHPKWREVNFAATLEGWRRAAEAQDWIDNARAAALADARERESFKAFLTQAGDVVSPESVSEADQEKLFRAFKAWSKAQQSN